MKSVQLRMARAAVGWSVRELAKRAGVTANTVTRIENGADAKQSTIEKLQHVLELAGAEFINGDRLGVRMSETEASLGEPKSAARPAPRTKQRRAKTAQATENKHRP